MNEKINAFFQDVFSVNENKATRDEIKERIIYNAKLKGINMWGIVFAIILVSIGLNIDSETVVVGAMMISPLMGGIQGIGYALATTNFKYFKRVLVGFIIEILVCLVTSFIYFSFSPIDTQNSVLLNEYSPKIWDAIIALVGGAAAILSITRKNSSTTVLSGAAIACTIMPPICKAGYGISRLDIVYTLNSLYLFFINAFFICLATIIILRIMKIPRRRGANRKEGIKIFFNIVVISIITLIPSSIFAYQAINETVLESNIKKYINLEFPKYDTQSVKTNVNLDKNLIEVVLIGKPLNTDKIKELTEKMKDYGIENMELKLTQTNLDDTVSDEELSELKAEILAIKNKMNDKTTTVDQDKIIEEISKKYEKVISCNIATAKTLEDNKSEYTTSTIIVTLTLKETLTKTENIQIKNILDNEFKNQLYDIQYVYK